MIYTECFSWYRFFYYILFWVAFRIIFFSFCVLFTRTEGNLVTPLQRRYGCGWWWVKSVKLCRNARHKIHKWNNEFRYQRGLSLCPKNNLRCKQNCLSFLTFAEKKWNKYCSFSNTQPKLFQSEICEQIVFCRPKNTIVDYWVCPKRKS